MLRTDSFKTLYASGEVYAFFRASEEQEALVVLNTGTATVRCAQDVTGMMASEFMRVWPHGDSQTYQTAEGQLEITLAPREAQILVSKSAS